MVSFGATCQQCGGKMAVGNKFCRRDCFNLHYGFSTEVSVTTVMKKINQDTPTEDIEGLKENV